MSTLIKITGSNADAIEQALRDVNGKATAHTMTDAREIFELARRAEAALDEIGLRKTLRAGATITAESGEAVAKAYNNARTGTRVVLIRKSADWYVQSMYRITLYAAGGAPDKLNLTAPAIEYLQEKLWRKYS